MSRSDREGAPFVEEIRPGELFVGGRRVAVMALANCVGGVAEVLMAAFGEEMVEKMLYETGTCMDGLLLETAKGATVEEKARNGLVDGFRAGGWGMLRVVSWDWPEPRIVVEIERGLTGLSGQAAGDGGLRPHCNVQRGMLVSFLGKMLREEGREADLYVHEETCTFRGSKKCRFIAAPAAALKAEGVAVLRGVPSLGRDLLEAVGRAEESEAMYRTLVNSVDSFIWLLDRDLRYVFMNERFFEYSGYRREDLVGRVATTIIHPEDLGGIFEGAEKVRSGQALGHIEYRVRLKDGSWRTHRAKVVPLWGKADEPPQLGLGISQDITEEKEKQERIDYLDSFRQGIIDNANVLIFSVDRNGLVTVFNKAMEQLTGYQRSDFLGRHFREILPRDLVAQVEVTISEHLRGVALEEWDLRVTARDGSIKVCRMQPSPVVVADEVMGVVEVGRDVTVEVSREYSEAYRAEMEKELEDMRRELEDRYQFSNIVARAPKMRRVFEVIRAVSASSATVLVQGETGTGKALVARAIHYNSRRRDRPFVEVDCGVLSETLLESELFGHVRGAFTGALKDKIGRFELANGGTIFLDEITNLSFPLQVKLLRAVQEGKFERVGGTDTIEVDVRIIAATNEDLAALAEQDRFRKDLYYRLNVIKIDLPPLRERREDISLLGMHFLERYAGKNGKALKGLSRGAVERLMSYDWPGNVRELENIIEQAVVFADGEWISPDDVNLPGDGRREYVPMVSEGGVLPLKRVLEVPERAYIGEVLKLVDGNKSRAARLLGISRSSLYEKITEYGLEE